MYSPRRSRLTACAGRITAGAGRYVRRPACDATVVDTCQRNPVGVWFGDEENASRRGMCVIWNAVSELRCRGQCGAPIAMAGRAGETCLCAGIGSNDKEG